MEIVLLALSSITHRQAQICKAVACLVCLPRVCIKNVRCSNKQHQAQLWDKAKQMKFIRGIAASKTDGLLHIK